MAVITSHILMVIMFSASKSQDQHYESKYLFLNETSCELIFKLQMKLFMGSASELLVTDTRNL